MRNWVSKNDYNRASVHIDQKKAWSPDTEEGLNEYFGTPFDESLESPLPEQETDEEFRDRIRSLSLAEYYRGVNASGIVY